MRFAVHHHINRNEHYDLMIEMEGTDTLPTWQIASQDLIYLLEGKTIVAERIQDHRKYYLDHEGSISGGRGYVKIFDTGNCSIRLNEGDMTHCELSGKMFCGNIILSKAGNNLYSIRYLPAALSS